MRSTVMAVACRWKLRVGALITEYPCRVEGSQSSRVLNCPVKVESTIRIRGAVDVVRALHSHRAMEMLNKMQNP